jgi:hypothetical protein
MPSAASLNQLEELAEEFARVRARFAALESRARDEEWNARPLPDEWSVAECIAHLNLTAAAMMPRLRQAFAEARERPPVGARKYRGAMFGRVLAAMVGPVPIVLGIRLGRTKTAAAFVPGSDLPRQRVASEFRHWNAEEAALVGEAEGLQVDRTEVESPFVKGARYDAYSAMWILARHEHRHLAQAERALARLRGAA